MEIVYDNIIFSLQRGGGISVVWKELIERVLGNSHVSPHFIEYAKNKDNLFYQKLPLSINTGEKKNPLLPMIERYRDVRIAKDTPFILHSSYYRICTNPLAINITTVHDFTYEYFRKGLAKKLHCWQKYRAIKHSDAIVCISENTKKDLIKFVPDIDEKKLSVIYNGVSEDYHVIDKQSLFNLPFPKDSFVVYVGSRTSYKNFDLTVRSVAQTNYNLLIVGAELSEEELKLLKKHIPEHRYKITGYLSNIQLNILYNSAAAFVYPSSYEGFGIPVIEAQRAGCPVIAYKGSSIPEIIGDTPLLMNELSEYELINKLKVLSDKELMNSVIYRGLENSKRFSWDRMYNEYIKLYENLWESKI